MIPTEPGQAIPKLHQASLVRGWLFFTSSKADVRFVRDKHSVYPEEVPWEVFCEDDELLEKFVKDFSLEREKSLTNSYAYQIDLDYDAIEHWLRENCEVIEIDEDAD